MWVGEFVGEWGWEWGCTPSGKRNMHRPPCCRCVLCVVCVSVGGWVNVLVVLHALREALCVGLLAAGVCVCMCVCECGWVDL